MEDQNKITIIRTKSVNPGRLPSLAIGQSWPIADFKNHNDRHVQIQFIGVSNEEGPTKGRDATVEVIDLSTYDFSTASSKQTHCQPYTVITTTEV